MSCATSVDFSFRCPFTLSCAGPTGAGKTSFLQRLISNSPKAYNKAPGPFFYFYNVHQPVFLEMERDFNVTFIQGMCTMDWIREHIDPTNNATIILDDLGKEITADTAEVFSVASHHFSCNVALIIHNLFNKNKNFRDISLNSKYICIMKNPRDISSILHFGKQFDPASGSRMIDIFRESTNRPYSYLFIDLDQNTSESHRMRSNIFFENNEPMKVYVRQ